MLQVWRGLEMQPGEDDWHNAGCTNIDIRCVSRLEIFNIYSTQYIQHVRLFWAAHLSMQRLQLFRQDLTNPRKLKHKTQKNSEGSRYWRLSCTGQPWWSWSWSRAGRTSSLRLPVLLHPCFEESASEEDGSNKHILHLETLCQHLVLCSINLGRKKSAETDVLVY